MLPSTSTSSVAMEECNRIELTAVNECIQKRENRGTYQSLLQSNDQITLGRYYEVPLPYSGVVPRLEPSSVL